MISERISDDISPLNENFEYSYPHSNALITFSLQKDSENVLCCAYMYSSCQLHKTACQLHMHLSHNDVEIPTVYRRIYCRKFMTLSNQMSRCICKCIRMYMYTYAVQSL